MQGKNVEDSVIVLTVICISQICDHDFFVFFFVCATAAVTWTQCGGNWQPSNRTLGTIAKYQKQFFYWFDQFRKDGVFSCLLLRLPIRNLINFFLFHAIIITLSVVLLCIDVIDEWGEDGLFLIWCFLFFNSNPLFVRIISYYIQFNGLLLLHEHITATIIDGSNSPYNSAI